MNNLRSRAEFAFGLAFYFALAVLLFDVIGNRKDRPPGYPPETWFTLHNYPISLIWNASLFVGAAVLFVGLPVALIVFILRSAKRNESDRDFSDKGASPHLPH